MSPYSDEETMEAEINRLVAEKFGPNEMPFDSDNPINDMLVYHDVHQVLATANLRDELEVAITSTTNGDELVEQLSALNYQTEGLRMVLYAAASDEDIEESVARLAHISFLNDMEIVRLRELIDLYASALQRIDDPDKLEFVDENDTETVLRCLTEEVLNSYLENLYVSQRWIAPIRALFAVDQLEKIFQSSDPNAFTPQTWFQIFLDENHYTAAIERFERLQQPFLADIARLFLFFGQFTRNILLDENYLKSATDEIRNVLDRIDQYSTADLSIFEDLEDMIVVIRGQLRLIIGIQSFVPLSERMKYLEKAERDFDACHILLMQTYGPMVRWLRSQMAQGYEREKLELSAFSRVNELLARSALEKEPLQRIASMTNLMSLPASWKFAKGDFPGAIETATMAKSMAAAFIDTIDEEIRPQLEEMQKDISSLSTSLEERVQIMNLRNALLKVRENSTAIVFALDLLILTCHAKLAEMHGDFIEAAQLYQNAARLQKEMLEQMRSLISTFFDMATASARMKEYGYQHEARATYFQGMALVNNGDRLLVEGDYVTANQRYLEAKLSFEATRGLWAQEVNRLPETQEEARKNAYQEQILNVSRMRYCDAKIEISTAEQFSTVLGQAWEASRHFEKAAGILGELLVISKEAGRNLDILRASEDFCKGRALLEMDRADRRQVNVQEGRELLDLAALRFEQANEIRWARYIQGLRLEYEAVIAWEVSQTAPPPSAANYILLAQNKARDAAAIFRQLGVENRARYLENWARTTATTDNYAFTTIVLPKPLDRLPGSQSPIQQLVDQYGQAQANIQVLEDKMKNELDRLQARSIALNRRLDDLKDRRDRGRIDEGRYTDLAFDLDRERIEILIEIRNTLQGRDEDIDAIIQDAINGEQEPILMDRLAQVAEQKGLGQRIIEGLNKHKGTIVTWLVEIGFQIAKRAGQA